MSEDATHAVERARLSKIDAFDACMGMRRAQDMAPQAVGTLDIRDVTAAAGQETAVDHADGPGAGKCRRRAADAQRTCHAPIDRMRANT